MPTRYLECGDTKEIGLRRPKNELKCPPPGTHFPGEGAGNRTKVGPTWRSLASFAPKRFIYLLLIVLGVCGWIWGWLVDALDQNGPEERKFVKEAKQFESSRPEGHAGRKI